MYCEYCDKQIDTDYDCEHFNDDGECIGKIEDEKNQIKLFDQEDPGDLQETELEQIARQNKAASKSKI
jgi:hypothetical protein